jgi:hypothetical protein
MFSGSNFAFYYLVFGENVDFLRKELTLLVFCLFFYKPAEDEFNIFKRHKAGALRQRGG